ncbi:MAG TPA: TonB-dependent siderophore receptor [Steroidobacteraceae bacterium]|nr:TonB-dependent siderophore receptor [Steroidobacteraceae bacterium]
MKTGIRPSIRFRALAGAALATAVKCAFAQTPAPPAATEEKVLAPVVVHGAGAVDYRATESRSGVLGDLPLLSTPYSVDVIPKSLLVDQQAAVLGDYLKNDPSATVGNVVIGFANLRGFALGSDGYRLDGLALGALMLDGRLFLPSFERIDVLKGASSVLYGGTAAAFGTSLGGTLNYIPAVPPAAAPVREAYATYNSTANVGVGIDLGNRLGGDRQFGYRLNAGARDGDVAVNDMAWGQNGASLVLDWRVNPDLLLAAGFYAVDNKYKNIQPFFVGAATSPGPVPAPSDARRNIGPSWSRFEQESALGWARADWAFAPKWTLTLQFGGGTNDRPNSGTLDTRFGVIDDDAGNATLFASEERSRTEVQTGQALVRGEFATGTLTHRLTLSASTYEEKNYSTFNVVGVVPAMLNGPDNTTPIPAFTPTTGLPYTGKGVSSGVLATDLISFDERWSVLLGGRQARVTTYDDTDTKVPGGEISKFSPTLALLFKPTPASLLYANYAEGLQPGGTAPVGATNVGAIMPPLVTRQYEIGAKLETSGLTLTGALFDMRRPLQIFDSTNTWVEGGDQVHQGLELQATGRLTPDLRVVTGLMYLDAKQQSTGNPLTDGKRVVGVPEWTANAYLDYRLAPGLFLNGGLYCSSSQKVDLANLQSIPSWTRLDIGARYETKVGGRGTTFLFAVENVTDRSYWASAIQQALTLGDPLTVKATARVAF